MASQSKHTNTCTVYCGYDINKNQNAIKSPRLLQSPYGYVSFRQLTVMKIIDRYSVYVSGLHPRIASIVTLSSDEWFGAFGAICQIRIIQGKAPHEAHLRFQFESSATNAINWVNTHLASRGLFAKNGYQKYCTKFLQRKICNRQSCSLLHAWKPFTEVLNPEKVRQLNPLKRGQVQYRPEQHNLPKVVMAATTTTCNHKPITKAIDKDLEGIAAAPQIHAIQDQITALQQSFDEAKMVVDQLIGEVNELEIENTYLRRENDELEKRRSHFASPEVSPVDTTTMEGEFGALPEMMSTTMQDVDEIVDALCGITWDCSPSSNSLTPPNMDSPTWNSSFEQHPFYMDSQQPTASE